MSHRHPLLLNGTELRAIGHRYRSAGAVDGEDGRRRQRNRAEGWLDLVNAPFESVDETLERLREVEGVFRTADDRRSVFLTVYTQMTTAVRDGVESGFFDDPAWVRRYLVAFANEYRTALVRYEREQRQRVPAPWRLAFDSSLGGSTLVLQDALLGVNAHITYDLTYTLEQIDITRNRRSKLRDHNRINEILERLVDAVQDALVSIYSADTVDDLDSLFGSFDESLAYYGLKEGRRFAWQNAVLLTDYGWPLLSRYVDWRVRSVSTGAANVILAPTLDRSRSRQVPVGDAATSSLEEFQTAFQQRIPAGDPATWTRSG
ncbi:MAG: DUF5995 family protein [Halolamina sp.]|uniref:DUF5995 family protein n=1 Tax=Halolamina sp. TaxID=1940283 RepID=UPI002FC27E72